MPDQSLNILLVYDNLDGRGQIEQILRATDIDDYRLQCVAAQSIIQGALPQRYQDVCLVESIADKATQLVLSLKAALDCPILVLTRDSGSEVLNALHCGASDCLIRNQLTSATLEESICAVVEHARSLDVLGQYERWYLSLVENSSDLIFTQDLEGNFSSINRVAEKLTGYTADEIVGMNFRQIVAPEYADLVWRCLLRMLEDRRPSNRELAIVSKSWQRIPVRMTAHLIYKYGSPIGVQGVMRVRAKAVSLRAAV